MLRTLRVQRFKSMRDTGDIPLASLTVLFGTNAAGKSNLLDAVQVLSRLASERTLADALGGPIRGLPLESFMFPAGGLPALLTAETTSFRIDSVIDTDTGPMRYGVEVAIKPSSGSLSVGDEYLAFLTKAGGPKGKPLIEKAGNVLQLRAKAAGRPRDHDLGLGYTLLSDERFSGERYEGVERVRDEMSSWRTYYLDPRVAMRAPQSPREVQDIGPLGEYVAPFLYRLSREKPKVFAAVRRTVRSLIPSVDEIAVDLDPHRGVLDVVVIQGGTPYSSRVVSEGTLRVLAIACVATNPWGGSVVAFEEPENGVHPRRVELIARILISLATDPGRRRQVIVTTHSPLFCNAVIRQARNPDDPGIQPGDIALYHVVREKGSTRVNSFKPPGPLFDDPDLATALTAPAEDGAFEGAMLRGLLDD